MLRASSGLGLACMLEKPADPGQDDLKEKIPTSGRVRGWGSGIKLKTVRI